MDLHGLTPLFTGLTLSVVAGICARSHHLATDSEDVFAVSSAVGYLMFGLGLLFCAAPFLPGASGDIPVIRFFSDVLTLLGWRILRWDLFFVISEDYGHHHDSRRISASSHSIF